jgi:serine/threonine-protein kinase HipA
LSIPSSELRYVDRAEVFKSGRLAGHLTRSRNAIEFRYLTRYIESGSPPIAVSLPFEKPVVRLPGGALPSYFTNLLPEGIRLLGLRRRTKTSLDDEMTLLLAVGRDCVGDVSIVVEGEALEPEMSPLVGYDVEDLFVRAQDAEDPSALSGVQEKISSSMLTLPGFDGHGPCIVKFAPPSLPLLIQNEHFFLRMAQGCGLEAAKSRVVPDEKGKVALWVDRFDRAAVGSGWERLAQEDCCQLLDALPRDKYAITVRQIATTFREHAAVPSVALLNLLQQLAFSYLIGNGDQHAKNISMGESPNGFMPTPVYDVLSTLFYPELDSHMALKMDGKDDRWKRKMFVAFFGRFELPERAVVRSLERLCDTSAAWIERLGEIGFDEGTTERVRREILKRREDLGRSE